MEVYQMEFRSVTQAQQAAHALVQAGIPAEVRRTSGSRDCGFSVAVPATARPLAERVVQSRGLMCRGACKEDPAQ